MTADEALEKLRECDHYLGELDIVRDELSRLREINQNLEDNLEATEGQWRERCDALSCEIMRLRRQREWLLDEAMKGRPRQTS